MAKKKTWQAPLYTTDQLNWKQELSAAKGSLMHHESDGWNTEITWVEAETLFHGTFTLDEGIHSGRSAKYVSWTDDQGRNFPMFVAELVKLVRLGVVEPGGVCTGTFKVVKRGQNYGVEYAGA